MSNNNDSTNTTTDADNVFGEHLEEYKRMNDAIRVLRDRQEQLNQEDEMFEAIDLGVLALVRLWTIHQTHPELGLLD